MGADALLVNNILTIIATILLVIALVLIFMNKNVAASVMSLLALTLVIIAVTQIKKPDEVIVELLPAPTPVTPPQQKVDLATKTNANQLQLGVVDDKAQYQSPFEGTQYMAGENGVLLPTTNSTPPVINAINEQLDPYATSLPPPYAPTGAPPSRIFQTSLVPPSNTQTMQEFAKFPAPDTGSIETQRFSKADTGELDAFATNGGVVIDYNNVMTPGGGDLGPAGKAVAANAKAALAPQESSRMSVAAQVMNSPEMMTPCPRGNPQYTPGLPSCCPSTPAEEIRNNGLYGIVGDLNCRISNRSTVSNRGFVEPLNARTEFLRYMSYDMPHKRDTTLIQRPNTANQQTYMYK